MIASINPATGEIVATFDSLTESQLDEKLARAAEAFRTRFNMSLIGSDKLISSPFHQLAFVTPGITPFDASSLKQIRHT